VQFGVQFFPCVDPVAKPAAIYFDECLRLVELCDPLGYSHVRTVEHYFLPYGGYSPNPIVFLSAAAQRAKKARMVTGAVLPVFNNPLKLAGEIGMLDAISGGRLDVGFARAFLPHEFRHFKVSLDESVARFDEGVAQIGALLSGENVTMEGRFHSFANVTSLPRPTQKPHPPFWTACNSTAESFAKAGRAGHGVLAIALIAPMLKELIATYRAAWKSAGHPGQGTVMIAFHMLCAETKAEADRIARAPCDAYFRSIVEAAGDWAAGTSSKDYKNYDKMIEQLRKDNYDTQVASGGVWAGEPNQIVDQIHRYQEAVGGFEVASMQTNFYDIGYETAARSMKLFGEKVIPQFR